MCKGEEKNVVVDAVDRGHGGPVERDDAAMILPLIILIGIRPGFEIKRAIPFRDCTSNHQLESTSFLSGP